MPRASLSLRAGVLAYIVAMTAIGVLGVKLASVVTAKAVALSLPYLLDKNPRKPSRVEQRRIDIAQAVPPLPVAKVAASVDAATTYDVLAGQLDLAEAENAKAEPGRARARRAKFPLRRLASKFATPPAADAFNRSFGVIPIASN